DYNRTTRSHPEASRRRHPAAANGSVDGRKLYYVKVLVDASDVDRVYELALLMLIAAFSLPLLIKYLVTLWEIYLTVSGLKIGCDYAYKARAASMRLNYTPIGIDLGTTYSYIDVLSARECLFRPTLMGGHGRVCHLGMQDASLSTGRAVGHDRAVWQELNNISLPRFEKKESYNLEEAITRRTKTLCLVCHVLHSGGRIDIAGYDKQWQRRREVKYRQSQEVLVDIPERITEHGLSSEITQSSGGSSDTSEGSENSGSFEDYGSSGEGLML
ncbi:retrovirus-related pol polyprotein from transposon TNT 1-94, partial [Tanacetum coccineum]